LASKLTRVGDSTALIVPAAVARAMQFEPGELWRVVLRTGDKPFTAKARKLSRSSRGLLVPVKVLRNSGLERGDVIEVPFLAWRRVRV